MYKEDYFTDCIIDLLRIIKKYKKKDEIIYNKIKRTLYDLLDPTYFDWKHNISKKAYLLVKKMKIEEDITYCNWEELGKYKIKGKRAFVIDYYFTRHHIVDILIKIIKPNKTKVLRTINKKFKTCIVTAKEGEILNNLGFNAERPDPKLAYKEADIKIKNKW